MKVVCRPVGSREDREDPQKVTVVLEVWMSPTEANALIGKSEGLPQEALDCMQEHLYRYARTSRQVKP